MFTKYSDEIDMGYMYDSLSEKDRRRYAAIQKTGAWRDSIHCYCDEDP